MTKEFVVIVSYLFLAITLQLYLGGSLFVGLIFLILGVGACYKLPTIRRALRTGIKEIINFLQQVQNHVFTLEVNNNILSEVIKNTKGDHLNLNIFKLLAKDLDIDSLASALKNTAFRSISLQHNNLRANDIVRFISKLKGSTITKIDFSFNMISQKVVNVPDGYDILLYDPLHPFEKRLLIPPVKIPRYRSQIQHVEDDELFGDLCAALTGTNIQELDLTCNNITINHPASVAKHIGKTTITALTISKESLPGAIQSALIKNKNKIKPLSGMILATLEPPMTDDLTIDTPDDNTQRNQKYQDCATDDEKLRWAGAILGSVPPEIRFMIVNKAVSTETKRFDCAKAIDTINTMRERLSTSST